MGAVYKRELRSYFCSMIAYIFISFVVLFIGFSFRDYNLSGGYPYFSYSLGSLMIIFVFTIPILTMKSFSEERKNKTDQLLLTAPISVSSVVMGKFLSMLTIFSIPLLISCICPLIITGFEYSYLWGDYMSIISFIFMGAMLVSMGMFISSLTENQIISAVTTLILMVLVLFWDTLAAIIPTTPMASLIGCLVLVVLIALMAYGLSKNKYIFFGISIVGLASVMVLYLLNSVRFTNLIPQMLSSFSITKIINNFTFYNVLDLGGLFFYLSVAALFIFLTIQNVLKRRWS